MLSSWPGEPAAEGSGKMAYERIVVNGLEFEVTASDGTGTYFEMRAVRAVVEGGVAVLAFHPRAGWTLDRKPVKSMTQVSS